MSHDELLQRLIAKAQKDGLQDKLPPLSEEVVAACEKEMGIKLPELVRLFYTRVSNGFVEEFRVMLPLYDKRKGVENVTATYLGMLESDEVIEDFDDEEGDVTLEWIPGVLVICDQGCGLRTVLDCNDPEGRMVEVDFDIGPANYKTEWENDSGYFSRPGIPFESWLLRWLEQPTAK